MLTSVKAQTRGSLPRVFCFLALTMAPGLRALELPFMEGGVELLTSRPAYWRYDLVEFEVRGQGGGLDAGQVPELEVTVYKDGKPVQGMPRKEVSLLSYDPDRALWSGTWPVPWNPVLGEYEGRLSRPDMRSPLRRLFSGPGAFAELRADPVRPLATCRFRVKGRKPAELPPGFSAVTLEPGGHKYSEFPGVDGERRSWRRLLDWCRFMHADSFWHCAAQTQVWGPDLDEAGFPWAKRHLEMGELLAHEAKFAGLSYGAYVLTFLVGGDYARSPYVFTTAYEASSDQLVKLRFVSMADPQRQRHLIDLLKQVSTWPGLTYIGMDYVRCDVGGLEMVDDFLSEMGWRVSAELRALPNLERQRWLGRLLAHDQDPGLEKLWDWWRAHRVSMVLKGILEAAAVTQPIFVFSLGWKQGHQHGQDPRMLIDAGVSFNAPMFYEANEAQHKAMLDDWAGYLKDTRGTLVFGQPVDTVLLKNSRGLNGPEEYFERQKEAWNQLGPHLGRAGFFWHDINRALGGGRSASTMREWALAGAASFSRLREAAGALPLSLQVQAPAWVSLSQSAQVSVAVHNLAAETLKRSRLESVWTEGLAPTLPAYYWIKDLDPGETRTLTFTVQALPKPLREKYQDTGEERMLAFRARAFPDVWKRPSIAFSYWKAPLPVSPTAEAGP